MILFREDFYWIKLTVQFCASTYGAHFYAPEVTYIFLLNLGVVKRFIFLLYLYFLNASFSTRQKYRKFWVHLFRIEWNVTPLLRLKGEDICMLHIVAPNMKFFAWLQAWGRSPRHCNKSKILQGGAAAPWGIWTCVPPLGFPGNNQVIIHFTLQALEGGWNTFLPWI